MSDRTYELLSWKGESQGSYSAYEIKRMWESDEITGLYQVNTDQGNLSIEEFVSYTEEQEQKESRRQQEQTAAQAQAANLKAQQQ